MSSTELLPGYVIQMHVNSDPVWWSPAYRGGFMAHKIGSQVPEDWTVNFTKAIVFADRWSAETVLSHLLSGIGAVVCRQVAAASEVARASN